MMGVPLDREFGGFLELPLRLYRWAAAVIGKKEKTKISGKKTRKNSRRFQVVLFY